MNGTFYTDGWGNREDTDPEDVFLDDASFSVRYGKHHIHFIYEGMQGQCGAGIIHDFSLPIITKRALYTLGIKFTEDLKEVKGEAGAKIIASAVVGSPLYTLLNNNLWQVGTARKNHNSGNNIVIFELDLRSK